MAQIEYYILMYMLKNKKTFVFIDNIMCGNIW